MPRMIELIRQSAVPANIMRTASRGALALPAAEMVEILVYLSSHPMFGPQATMTLASWDEKSACAIASDPATPAEVLAYLSDARNLRLPLLPALMENPSVQESRLMSLAATGSREVVTALLGCSRVRASANLLHAISSNPAIDEAERKVLRDALATLGSHSDDSEVEAETQQATEQYAREHASEIASEEGKGFELVVGAPDEEDDLAAMLPQAPGATIATAAQPEQVATAVAAANKPAQPPERERLSVLQKIARLTVGERVQLAMKGNKDERFVLVRDGSKVVCCAVLESPKLTDSEVEGIAAMKNVQEAVLRAVASKRKFLKNYAVIRALVNNPRVPLDVSLPLLNHLLVNDLKNVSMNKNISETVRKLALKQFKEKSESRKKE